MDNDNHQPSITKVLWEKCAKLKRLFMRAKYKTMTSPASS